jgi:hypothetical protein
LLSRGSIVSGATRFRWPPLEVTSNEVETLLRRFPDADPARAFHPADCTHVVLRGPLKTVYLARETAARRGLLRRRTVWDVLMECAGQSVLEYVDYSYRDRADRYRLKLSPEAARELGAFGYSAGTAEYFVGR